MDRNRNGGWHSRRVLRPTLRLEPTCGLWGCGVPPVQQQQQQRRGCCPAGRLGGWAPDDTARARPARPPTAPNNPPPSGPVAEAPSTHIPARRTRGAMSEVVILAPCSFVVFCCCYQQPAAERCAWRGFLNNNGDQRHLAKTPERAPPSSQPNCTESDITVLATSFVACNFSFRPIGFVVKSTCSSTSLLSFEPPQKGERQISGLCGTQNAAKSSAGGTSSTQGAGISPPVPVEPGRGLRWCCQLKKHVSRPIRVLRLKTLVKLM